MFPTSENDCSSLCCWTDLWQLSSRTLPHPCPLPVHPLIQNPLIFFLLQLFFWSKSHFSLLDYCRSSLTHLFAATQSPYFQLSRLRPFVFCFLEHKSDTISLKKNSLNFPSYAGQKPVLKMTCKDLFDQPLQDFKNLFLSFRSILLASLLAFKQATLSSQGLCTCHSQPTENVPRYMPDSLQQPQDFAQKTPSQQDPPWLSCIILPHNAFLLPLHYFSHSTCNEFYLFIWFISQHSPFNSKHQESGPSLTFIFPVLTTVYGTWKMHIDIVE